MCSKFNFMAIFLILVNFAAFLGHRKENADARKKMGNLRLIFIFTESICLRLHKI